MSHIQNVLSCATLQNEDTESLKYIRMHSEAACEGLLSGLGAIGNIAFYACDNENYSDKDARSDLCALGEMLIHIPGIVAALEFNANQADFNIKEQERKAKR